MEYHLLVETPPNSGQYEATGEVLIGTIQDALTECINRSQEGFRTALYPYEPVRQASGLIPTPTGMSTEQDAAED